MKERIPPEISPMQGPQIALLAILALAFTYATLLGLKHETGDEGFHTPQIWDFYTENFKIAKELTMLPVYHGVIAGMLKLSQFFSIPYARFCHLIISAFAIPLFYFVSKRLQNRHSDTRTLLFLFSPVLLPFFSLIYTDIPALIFVLAMFLFHLRGKYWLAAVFALIAIAMRQTNIIWLGFVGTLAITEYFLHQGVKGFRDIKTGLWPLFLRLIPYGLVVGVVVVFFAINGSVAVGDAHQHQVGFNLSNLYFLLLVAFALFLPYNLAYGKKVYTFLLSSAWVWGSIGGMFIVYLATYNNSHQYNSYGLDFYLRNVVLHFTVSNLILKVLAFIAIAWMGLTLTQFYRESNRKLLLGMLYAFSILSVIPLPLIEQRYYIVAFVGLLLLKPETDYRLDLATLYLYVPVNCVLLWGIANHHFFL